MSRDRVATATQATVDWSFIDDEDIYGAVKKAARKAVSRFDLVEHEDALQDASLWLAARPEVTANYRSCTDYDSLAQNIYAGLKGSYIRESDQSNKTLSREALLEMEVE